MAGKKRLAAAFAFLLLAVPALAETFIRVDEDESATRLQTAVTRYEKDGTDVELIGAIHIADRAYYQKLAARFTTYDSLLFEMIGGEKHTAARPPVDLTLPRLEKEKNLSGLHRIYGMVARYLELSGQSESIDYTTKNFIHADLTIAEFNRLESERHESLIGFALKASKANRDAPNQPNPAKLLHAVLSGSSNLVKLEIIHSLGHADDQIAALSGESVIITDRNNRCLEVMKGELAAGHKNLGIFYGAAHFPDMEKRLLDLGFKRTKQEWLTAWDVPKAAEKPAVDLEKAS